MKKCFIIVALLVLLVFSAAAQTNGFMGTGFVYGLSFGLLSGTSDEIVYIGNKGNEKLSQLLWHFNPVLYAGINLNVNFPVQKNWGFFVDGAAKYGFPSEFGTMEDYDWVLWHYFGFRYLDWVSHYSVSDNKTESAFLVDASFGSFFAVSNVYQIRAFISYSYMGWSWTAKGGSLLYLFEETDGDNTWVTGYGGHVLEGRVIYYPDSVDVVKYRQKWNMVWAGVSLYGNFYPHINFNLSLKLSPLVWLNAVDNHLIRDPPMTVTTRSFGGLAFEPGLDLNFNMGRYVSLGLNIKYRQILGVRGDGVYEHEGGQSFIHVNGIGGGYSAFDFNVGARGRF